MTDQQAIADASARMIVAIEHDAKETANWTGRPAFSKAVMNAMACVPRHTFIASYEPYAAYANRPAPIGHGQTISQPYIVALMTDLLDLDANDKVLEIGTGCGYQSAVLAEIAMQVYSVETVEPLALTADKRLKQLGYANINIRVGDGYAGWPEESPFDAIIVTAAPPYVPKALIEQLATGGRMIVPVGKPYATQWLYRITRRKDGQCDETGVLPVAFVPMVESEEP